MWSRSNRMSSQRRIRCESIPQVEDDQRLNTIRINPGCYRRSVITRVRVVEISRHIPVEIPSPNPEDLGPRLLIDTPSVERVADRSIVGRSSTPRAARDPIGTRRASPSPLAGKPRSLMHRREHRRRRNRDAENLDRLLRRAAVDVEIAHPTGLYPHELRPNQERDQPCQSKHNTLRHTERTPRAIATGFCGLLVIRKVGHAAIYEPLPSSVPVAPSPLAGEGRGEGFAPQVRRLRVACSSGA